MQRGGRRRDRAFLARKHGLIVDPVLLVGRATSGDIGRKRHVAALLDRLVEYGAMERERERRLPARALLLDDLVELTEDAHFALLPETQHVARRDLFCRLEESAPARAVEAAMQGRCDFRLRTLEHAAMEPS